MCRINYLVVNILVYLFIYLHSVLLILQHFPDYMYVDFPFLGAFVQNL